MPSPAPLFLHAPDRQGPRTLYDKLVDAHTVCSLGGEERLLYVDLHVMNEYTSPQAFTGLREAGRRPWRPSAQLAVVDHVNPTAPQRTEEVADEGAAAQIRYLRRNCADFGIELIDLVDPRQGIEHVVVPDLGLAQPGMTILCGDSHTTTYGAFGALGYGIGTSEVEHVLATQTVVHRRLAPMRVILDGKAGEGVGAKDLIMAVIATLGADGAAGHAVEFAGEAIRALSMEGRMTICNMAVECGARVALIAPDAVTADYVRSRPRAPSGADWERAMALWAGFHSDEDAHFLRDVRFDAAAVRPLVTWGTSPDQAVAVDGTVPDPGTETDPTRRRAMVRALEYMGLAPGTPVENIAIDHAFIGSCTNARIEDLRAVAGVAKGRRVAPGVRAMVVPGSGAVRRQAEAEGIDRVLIAAGFEWRQPGCSMCLAMNDDVLPDGARCASSTNRNFEGRQGRGARTHLMSPALVAASAIAGRLCDPRDLP